MSRWMKRWWRSGKKGPIERFALLEKEDFV
jgi:hypothetical protein